VISGDITYIHRIVKIDIQFGETVYYTQGDNSLTNPIVDPKIKENQIIGKVHMSKRAINKALNRIKNGETTIAHALGMSIKTEPMTPIIIRNAYIKATDPKGDFRKNTSLILDMTYEEFEAVIIKANKEGIRSTNHMLFRWRHPECGKIFSDTMNNIKSRINPCKLCSKKTSEGFTRSIADHIFHGMIKDGLNFEKDIKLLRFIDKATLSKYLVIQLAHVDMYAILEINGKQYHLVIEHDGKQHDQDDPHGALRAYLGIQAKNGRFTTEEVNQILADPTSTDYNKYMAELEKLWRRDDKKDQLFSDLKKDNYYLIRVKAYKVSGIENVQKHIIKEFLKLTNINIPYSYFNPFKL
jgi:hypothetical protein